MIKHIIGERAVSVIHDTKDDGRVFTTVSGYPESEFCWRLNYGKPNKTDQVNAVSIISTFRYLMEADRKEAEKQLGHLRAAYRASQKWSPE